MMLVYVAGPFAPTAIQREHLPDSEDVSEREMALMVDGYFAENVTRAERFGLLVAENGHMPIIPHANTRLAAFRRLHDADWWYAATLELMRRCDAVALMPTWLESKGAMNEAREAVALGKPVYLGVPSESTQLGPMAWERVKDLELRLRQIREVAR